MSRSYRLVMLTVFVFFFFKQKTAYEMRISDWSSDVCSSDLLRQARPSQDGPGQARRQEARAEEAGEQQAGGGEADAHQAGHRAAGQPPPLRQGAPDQRLRADDPGADPPRRRPRLLDEAFRRGGSTGAVGAQAGGGPRPLHASP